MGGREGTVKRAMEKYGDAKQTSDQKKYSVLIIAALKGGKRREARNLEVKH